MHDEIALALAGKLQARVAPAQVLLFGSRARGDWTAESDIDLMVLDSEALPQARQVRLSGELTEEAERIYGHPVPVQLFSFTMQEFQRARVAPMHLAGGAQRDGLTVEGKSMPLIRQNNPWPDVQQRLRVAQTSLYTACVLEGEAQYKAAGVEACHALENVLKAYASTLGLAFRKTHDVVWLACRIHAVERHVDLPAQPWLKAMHALRSTGPSDADYGLFEAADRIIDTVQAVCGRVAARVLTMLDKRPAQVGYAHWPADRPFGGMEDVDRTEFNLERKLAAAERAERKQTILEFAHFWLTADRLAALSRWLDDTSVEDWPPVPDLLASWQRSDNADATEYKD